MSDEKAGFTGWAIVELLGHKKMAGFLSEQPIAGGVMLRVDVPETSPSEAERSRARAVEGWSPPATVGYTKLVGLGSIYGITPVTEDVARLAAREIERYNEPLPVSLPALAAKSSAVEADVVENESDDLPY